MKKLIVIGIILFSLGSCKKPNTEAEQYLILVHNTIEPVYSYINYSMSQMKALAEQDQIEMNELRNSEIRSISLTLDTLQRLCDSAIINLQDIGPFEGNGAVISHYINTIEGFNRDFILSFNELIKNWNEDTVNYLSEKMFEQTLIRITKNEIARINTLKKYKKDNHLKPEIIKLWIKKRKAKSTLAFLKRTSNKTSCIEGDCINGFGKSLDNTGSKYTGNFKDGLFHGEGKLEYSDGEIYIGEFNMGEFDGYGEYRWKDGNIYKGEWENTDLNGLGTMIWADGDSTTGIWKNGKIINE